MRVRTEVLDMAWVIIQGKICDSLIHAREMLNVNVFASNKLPFVPKGMSNFSLTCSALFSSNLTSLPRPSHRFRLSNAPKIFLATCLILQCSAM